MGPRVGPTAVWTIGKTEEDSCPFLELKDSSSVVQPVADTKLTELSWLTKLFLNKEFLKTPTKALKCMKVSLMYSNKRHVSATHVAFFRAVRTRI